MNMRKFLSSLAVNSLIGIGFAAAIATPTAPAASPEVEREVQDNRAALIAEMMTENGCWTENGPKNVIPGKTVYSHGENGPVMVGGPKVTGKALEQYFGGKDSGLTVYGFCR